MLLDGDEKRTFARMNVDCDVTYRHINEATMITGTGINLSGNGIMFTTQEILKVGNKLELNVVPHSKSLTPPLNAIVNIVRIIPGNTPGSYNIGGSFDKIFGNHS